MHLVNDSPSFTPVHSQIRAIGPQDLHLGKGRGPIRRLPLQGSSRERRSILAMIRKDDSRTGVGW